MKIVKMGRKKMKGKKAILRSAKYINFDTGTSV
jgi:hypothetical protein